MDLSLTADQEALRDAAGRLYAKESSPERVREAEATGFDPALWEAVVGMGLPTMATAPEVGGADASLVDLAVAVEQHGAHVGSVPLVETAVVARLLAQHRDHEVAAAALGRLARGAPASLALRAVDGGPAAGVPYGAVAEVVVVHSGDALVVAVDPPATARRTLSALAVGDVELTGGVELARGEAAGAAFARAVDEWRTLTALAQAGLARTALDTGVQYAKDRQQFGVAIGSFQTIQHRFADLHARVDAARLLAYEAAWALDADAGQAPQLAAQAGWFCGEAAEDAAGFSLHVHGGYGFMLEYDVQLHVRRAKALRLLLGDPRDELDVVARRRWDGEERTEEATGPPIAPREGMDFSFPEATEAFRAEVRAFIDEHLDDEIIERAHRTGTMHDWRFHRALCERGYLAAGWPTDVGGLGRDPIEQTLLMQELYGAGAPVDGMGIAAMVGATLLLRGNDHQRREVLPRILAGEVMCCLGYSEPDAGSDVAAVTTRAVRDGDDWVITGQKMFTTMAHEAHYVFLLTRSDPDAPKHKGLTMFLVPMDAPGIEITPVETMGGERTNITFYSEVRVPDSCRVGDVGDGWSVMHAALVYERNSANWGEPNRLVEAVAAWATTPGVDGGRPFDDVRLRESLARAATELEAGRLLLLRSAWMASRGELPQVEGSMAKLVLTETFVRASAELAGALGAQGLYPRGEPGAVLDGLVEHAFRHSVVTTIYGGSSEVQREIIAQRGLGLPRSR